MRSLIATSFGKSMGALVAVLIGVDGVTGFKIVPYIYGLLFKVDVKWFMGVGFLIILFVAFRPPSDNRIRSLFVLIGLILCLPVVTYIDSSIPTELIVVYDEAGSQMYPDDLRERAVELRDVNKLLQVGEIKNNTLLVSLVERPGQKWDRVLGPNFTPDKKILSLREVLSDESKLFVDISASDFKQEILTVVHNRGTSFENTVIYFLDEYRVAAIELERVIRNEYPRTPVTLVSYRDKSTGLVHQKNSLVIYLGSPQLFPAYVRRVSTTEYEMLVAPNWVVGEIELPSADTTNKGIVAVSTPAWKLAKADYRHWSSLIALIREADQKKADVKSFIENRISKGSTIHEVDFNVNDLKR